MTTAVASSLLTAFRKDCELDDVDHEYVSQLRSYTERSVPAKLREPAPASGGPGSAVLDERIENIQQFYNWMDSLDGQSDTKEEEAYSLYQERLRLYETCSKDILTELDHSLAALDKLTGQYNLVSTKTGELHQDCEQLLQEQQNLVHFTNLVEKRLAYFNEVESTQKLFNRPNISVLDPNFLKSLQALDESISFISENPSFRESRIYMMKFQQLQTRGLTMVKSYIVASLRSTGKNMAETFESRTYIKFRALAGSLRPLCREIESRIQRREYQRLLSDCHYCYFQQRNNLLYSDVLNNIRQCNEYEDLATMIRSGCAYFIRLCQNEYELYHMFFSSFSTAMRNLLEGFGDLFYSSLRPRFIRAQEVDVLCSSAHILKSEILFTIQEKGESVQAFLGIINRMLEDIQERLIFLSQRFILDNISTFTPSASDIDYPARLQSSKEADSQNMYSAWYPTLEKTLMFLSRLYLNIDAKIFEGLAQETVSECCHSLTYASALIKKNHTWEDGQLFLIQHLMILREQITPFDISFCITEKELDFSPMRDAFSSLFRGKFSWVGTSPKVIETQVDSKKALEKALSDAVDAFCVRACNEPLEPLVSFLTPAESFQRIHGDTKPLHAQSFADPASLKTILVRVEKNILSLRSSVLQIRLFFSNHSNQSKMFMYLRNAVLAPFIRFQKLLETQYTAEDKEFIGFSMDRINQVVDFTAWPLEEDKNPGHLSVSTGNPS